MKFLCVPCDEVMAFAERDLPGDGTLTAVFTCPGCDREMAMLTNPMETQLVTSLGVEIGGRTVPEQPMQQTRMGLEAPRDDALELATELESATEEGAEPAAQPAARPILEEASEPAPRGRVTWSTEATERLEGVPRFVRGMVKRIYAEYASENGISVITPAIMDRARSDLGLEGM